ncbi:MAG: hypothetical protein KF861_03130 [Planctomycetaceae bacterium]|nr:hypothetical protein [Planctomycetaceae bacterium]
MNEYRRPSAPTSDAPRSRPAQAAGVQPQDARERISAAAQMCSALLESELAFCNELDQLLAAVMTADLFSTEAAASLSHQMDELRRQREEQGEARVHCQRALSSLLGPSGGPHRISALDRWLPEHERAEFRQLRLRVVQRLEGLQTLMQRSDRVVASRVYLFADLIAALTGQPLTADCYGADGRRERHVGGTLLEAVS